MTNKEQAFQPIQFNSGTVLKNRVVMAPLTTQNSYANGMISEAELAYYKIRSRGAGAVITAATYVSSLGRTFVGGPGADKQEHLPGLTKLARTIKAEGAKAILQIFHGGRMVEPSRIEGSQPVSASAIKALRATSVVPRALTTEEILTVIEDFGVATKRAIEAGFDGIEIHGANTYLIQQFFSPHSNRRTDEWGGTLEKRMAFPLAIIDKVKTVVAEQTTKPFIIGYRLSPEELEEPGITLQETAALIEEIIAKEIDYLHISLGSIDKTSIRDESNLRPILEIISNQVNHRIPLIGVGSIKDKESIDRALETMDLVAIGRQLIVDPSFVEKIQNHDYQAVRHNLSYYDKELLNLSDPTWHYINAIPGWFPMSASNGGTSTNEPWIKKK